MGPAITQPFHKQAHMEQLLCARCCVLWPTYKTGGHLVCWPPNPFLTLDTENCRGRRTNLALPGRKLPGHPDIDLWSGLSLKDPPGQMLGSCVLIWLCFCLTSPQALLQRITVKAHRDFHVPFFL